MSELVVTCPNCQHEVPLTASLAAPLIEATRARYEKQIAEKDQDIAEREAELRANTTALAKEKAEIDKHVFDRVQAERTRIASEEATKAKRLAALEIDQKAGEIAELHALLRQRDAKLADAQQAQADLIRKQRELDDAKREVELTIEKRVGASLSAVREQAKQEAEEGLKLRVKEKEEQISSMQRQIEDLKRRAEQGSQQLQGEAQELELEAVLRVQFPRDTIEPVPKGEFGGDIVHRVIGPSGHECGTILWECKRTKNFSDGWLSKLRDDHRKAKAEVAILVSNVLPKGVTSFDLIDGVWVTDARFATPLAVVIRQSLIEVAAMRQAGEGQQSKMQLVYSYLTGPRFRHRVEAIVEKFSEMQEDLERERRVMTKQWSKRETQIRDVIDATAGMYGDLQGIAGKALEEIHGIAAPLIEDQIGPENRDVKAA